MRQSAACRNPNPKLGAPRHGKCTRAPHSLGLARPWPWPWPWPWQDKQLGQVDQGIYVAAHKDNLRGNSPSLGRSSASFSIMSPFSKPLQNIFGNSGVLHVHEIGAREDVRRSHYSTASFPIIESVGVVVSSADPSINSAFRERPSNHPGFFGFERTMRSTCEGQIVLPSLSGKNAGTFLASSSTERPQPSLAFLTDTEPYALFKCRLCSSPRPSRRIGIVS